MKKKVWITIIIILCIGIIATPIIYFATTPQVKTEALVYGVDGIGNGPTKLTRTDDAEGMSYSFSGGFASDFDKAYPWSHMQTVKDEFDNVFVKIPKFYSKYTPNADGSCKLQISNKKLEGFSTLFIDGKGNELDYVMVGAYEATGTAERIYSKAGGFPLTGLTMDQFRVASMSNGKGYQQYDYLIMNIVNQLFTVEFATTDSQSIFIGYTLESISGQHTTGITDATGKDTCRMDSGSFKYRGIENVWGHKFKFVDGITFEGSLIHLSTNPEKYTTGVENLNDTYNVIGVSRVFSEGWVRGLNVDKNNSALVYINGTVKLYIDSTYNLADYHYFGKKDNPGQVMTYGGTTTYGERAGAWCWYTDQKPTGASTQITARLCYKPLNTFVSV